MDETLFEFEDRYEWLSDDQPLPRLSEPYQTEATAVEVDED